MGTVIQKAPGQKFCPVCKKVISHLLTDSFLRNLGLADVYLGFCRHLHPFIPKHIHQNMH